MQSAQNNYWESLLYIKKYVIVIARDRVQYEIYFPSSDIFVSLFSEPSGEENNNKISERGKYIHIVRVTCDNYFIISTKKYLNFGIF